MPGPPVGRVRVSCCSDSSAESNAGTAFPPELNNKKIIFHYQ